ncbi:zeta toxin family protein [Tetragenococcus halophilus]|uniref:zeta toxin family protein n=1 Tax=Tetragenococcus halophilus TaxID=51669 RepID=UPI00256B17D6|nr:zeta toxin family protein [Tetragenococcus halophilus]GMG67838.1 zeta toxin family protein [Tetragenococcus halophilus]
MDDQSILYVKAHKNEFLKKLVEDKYPAETGKKTAIFMAGSPGAGKSEVASSLAVMLENVCIIDADIFRTYFPQYNGHNSDEFQRGAALMVDYALDYVLKKGYSFILDDTFAIDKSLKNVRRTLKREYNTSIYYVYQNPFVAWQFTKIRERVEGRYVPKERFINAYFKSRYNVKKVMEAIGDEADIVVVLKDFQNAISDIIEGVENIDLIIPDQFSFEELEARLDGK